MALSLGGSVLHRYRKEQKAKNGPKPTGVQIRRAHNSQKRGKALAGKAGRSASPNDGLTRVDMIAAVLARHLRRTVRELTALLNKEYHWQTTESAVTGHLYTRRDQFVHTPADRKQSPSHLVVEVGGISHLRSTTEHPSVTVCQAPGDVGRHLGPGSQERPAACCLHIFKNCRYRDAPFNNLPESYRGFLSEGLTAATMDICRWLDSFPVARIELLELGAG